MRKIHGSPRNNALQLAQFICHLVVKQMKPAGSLHIRIINNAND
jgi:hypothetical protein